MSQVSRPTSEVARSALTADTKRTAQGITAIIPAYNEEASIAETIQSLQAQSLALHEILVVDDCSTDRTAEIATKLGARVLRPPQNTGSKAGAQTFALDFVETEFCIAIDADTLVEPSAVEAMMPAFDDPLVAAACGFVLPRFVGSIWERGRYTEYLFAFSFYKPVQEFFGRPLISSGCLSAYRTSVVRAVGGWSSRTMAEDMDLTWTLYQEGYKVRFIPEAVCYPIEPANFDFLSKQLRRWSHGFVQNARRHWRGIVHQPYLRFMIAVGIWDATIASLAYLVVLPLLAIFIHPLFLVGYIIDLPAVAVPVLLAGARRGEFWKALVSLPCFVVIRLVNAAFMLRAVWSEFVLGRSLLVYEKGH